MSQQFSDAPLRRMRKISTATEYCGLARSTLYLLAGKHPELFRKAGKAVLVDFAVLDRILDSLPSAKIGQYRSTAERRASKAEPTAA